MCLLRNPELLSDALNLERDRDLDRAPLDRGSHNLLSAAEAAVDVMFAPSKPQRAVYKPQELSNMPLECVGCENFDEKDDSSIY
jgi:hypothetical protein